MKGCGLLFTHLITGCAASGYPPSEIASEYAVTIQRGDNVVEASNEGDEVVFEVWSQSGIGKASIARRGPKWPENVSIRLYLKGLEAFSIESGDIAIHVSIPSHEAGVVRQTTLFNALEEQVLDSHSPYWLKIVRGGPLAKKDYFQLKIPRSLLQNPLLELSWIDFYR